MLFFFGPFEPEPLEKKYQEQEPEPLGKEIQEPEPLKKKSGAGAAKKFAGSPALVFSHSLFHSLHMLCPQEGMGRDVHAGFMRWTPSLTTC